MKTKTYKAIAQEAAELGIVLDHHADGSIRFLAAGNARAWMYRQAGVWKGYTEQPEVTGRKRGEKGEVADWCLSWAADGF